MQKNTVVTTFQLPRKLHEQLKLACVLTNKQMGQFIRICIRDKLKELDIADIEDLI